MTVALISSQLRENYAEMAKDQLIIIMANDFVEGIKKGHCEMSDLDRFEVMEWANAYYSAEGGKTQPLTIGSVIEGIKLVVNELEKDEDQ